MYSEPGKKSRMELFEKIVNSWKTLTIFPESPILDARQGSEYDCVHDTVVYVKQLFLNVIFHLYSNSRLFHHFCNLCIGTGAGDYNQNPFFTHAFISG